ncbi:hypothetical protein E2C01_077741 [Portunus trituberculatus]|nr:hypothetical protein [Portunus trituberculatus]
MHCSGRT